jgi:hypothetical protein
MMVTRLMVTSTTNMLEDIISKQQGKGKGRTMTTASFLWRLIDQEKALKHTTISRKNEGGRRNQFLENCTDILRLMGMGSLQDKVARARLQVQRGGGGAIVIDNDKGAATRMATILSLL